MNKLKVVLLVLLSMAAVNEVAAYDTIQANKVAIDADSDYCYTYFAVDAPADANYYIAFWLMPARYTDGSFTVYRVYVNSNYVGNVIPMQGNWQSATISGNPAVKFRKGVNVISIASAAPEVPMVESVVLSDTRTKASISSEQYNNYLRRATSGDLVAIEEESTSAGLAMAASVASNSSGLVVNNQPLSYTFYVIQDFAAQQDVNITSLSDTPHLVDALYYQTNEPAIDDDPIIGPIAPAAITPGLGLINPPKIISYFIYSDSEERQGLNWKGVSEQALNSNKQVCSMRFTAEKAGKYLIRVRSRDNYQLGVADVVINGSYYYEDVPISSSYAEIQMPADGQEYATFTFCDNSSTDDPMLFIHGADADRIVGFNDDVDSSDMVSGMAEYDAYVAQTYIIPTTRVSVNSYRSTNPESSCTIYARVPTTEATTMEQGRKRKLGGDQAAIDAVVESSIIISSQVRVGSSFSVKSTDEIKHISVYNLAGTLVGEKYCNDCVLTVETASLNINTKGVYIFRVETISGNAVTQKVVAW